MRRSRNIAAARRKGREDRIETIDHGFVAADHQTIAALQAPDAPAGAGIDIMDAFRRDLLGAPDIVLPKRIAAIDDDVVTLQQRSERGDGLLRRAARGQHDPDSARRLEAPHEIVQTRGTGDLAAGQRTNRFGVAIEYDTFVTVGGKAAGDVATHPSQADDPKLHHLPPVLSLATQL
jgi:hypothetical protein